MDRLTAARVFVEVVDRGSLTGASKTLDMSRAMVSRYIAEMEEWAGARLMHRTTRRLSLTDAGIETLPRCRQMLAVAGEMRCAPDIDGAPRGMLRLTCSMSLGHAYLAPLVTDYVGRYPGTAIDMLLVDRTVNLVEERVDLAIRVTSELDSSLIARPLGRCASIVCAAPSYLRAHGTPRRAEELADHNCLTYTYFGKSQWRFLRDGQVVSVPVGGNVSANEVTVLREAAVAGAGIAMQPAYSVQSSIRDGKLVALLSDHQPEDMTVYAVYASRKHMPAILRTLIDFLAERFSSDPMWSAPGVTIDGAPTAAGRTRGKP
jgi:DNA-binding transcriptional LysR family regulator